VGLHAVTIFLSAFLLFQIQPLIARYLLPWFGGTAAVWTTCMLFYQIVLLAGYAYAHLIRTQLSNRGQMIVHMAVLIAAAALTVLLRITPLEALKPQEAGDPTWRILGTLAATVGIPYFALSATSPLLMAWFSVTRPGASPYRLYAISNAGSLLALASYPFVVEPLLRLRMQADVWSALFISFAFLCGACAVFLWRTKPTLDAAPAPAATVPLVRPGLMARGLWLALPACGSTLLLAVTNEMCSDVGVVPDLWILPLALYLVSFILCFESDRLYQRAIFWPLLVVAGGVALALLYGGVNVPIVLQIAGYSFVLFACCMVCHGELARLKPDPRLLTSYYLSISAGGAVGGVFVGLVAPVVFSGYFELHVALGACFVLTALIFWREGIRTPRWRWRWAFPIVGVATVAVPILLVSGLVMQAQDEFQWAISVSRNFYGVLTVTEYNPDDPLTMYYSLCHGRILHGTQYTNAPLRYEPTTYYGDVSGVGLAIHHGCEGAAPKVGVVGLGTGTLASYGRPGATYRFYEINPAVLNLATSRFTYLADSRAKCEVVMGDARLSMEREEPQQYDVLAIDAFSSDAIPVHLLTEEAFAVYFRHLKPTGVLAVHISNRFLDLEPVVLGLADRFGLGTAVITSEDNDETGLMGATWVLVTANLEFLEYEPIRNASRPASENTTARIDWTDDYSNLIRIVKLEWPKR
jgi:SAM-dependent methyltransferase